MGTRAVRQNKFEPEYDFGLADQDWNTLRIHLPGFKKEELRIQLISRSSVRVLKITGKRTLEDKTQLEFEKDLVVSEDCDTNKITARFEGGILRVMNVKLIEQHKQIPPPETPKDSPATETDQEQAATQKTTPDKPVQNKVAKDEPKADASEGTKKDKREKNSNIRDGEQNAGENMYRKNNADRSVNKGTNYDNAKLKAETLAYKLKMDRQKMTMLLAFLFAFALAMCISNLQTCFFKKKT